MNVITLDSSALDAHPRDLNSIAGHSGDNRTLDKYDFVV